MDAARCQQRITARGYFRIALGDIETVPFQRGIRQIGAGRAHGADAFRQFIRKQRKITRCMIGSVEREFIYDVRKHERRLRPRLRRVVHRDQHGAVHRALGQRAPGGWREQLVILRFRLVLTGFVIRRIGLRGVALRRAGRLQRGGIGDDDDMCVPFGRAGFTTAAENGVKNRTTGQHQQ
ncbi:hypothetical protein SDC9_185744 [bioreactor metagenome]|uniref:Uncharacterized protein n=1 Tax=bioreactor metagenome TaxID=1076179 RepID=A0A645HHK7_9ZZZZ